MSGNLSAEEKAKIEQALAAIKDPVFVENLLIMLFDKDVEKAVQDELKTILKKLENEKNTKTAAVYRQLFELQALAHVQEPERLRYRIIPGYEMINTLTLNDFRENQENETPDGIISVIKKDTVFELKDIEKAASSLGTSTKKLFYYCLAKITETKGNETCFKINIFDYAELNGIELSTKVKKDHFCNNLKSDLSLLASLRIKTKKGGFRYLIGGYDPLDKHGNYSIALIEDTRQAIRAQGTLYTSMPILLFRHKNKSPNSFVCGVKLNYHYDNAGNVKNSTVISVKKLIEALPEISKEQSKNWKKTQKQVLEKALDENIEIGFLHSWHYRTADGKKISAAEASKLIYRDYENLMIEFTPKVLKTTANNTVKKLESKV